jgi:hypothetical protein
MNAPTPLVLANNQRPEIGGDTGRTLVDRFTDHAAPTTDRFLQVRWMNDKSGNWSNVKKINLGQTGATSLDRQLAPMGQYVSRQYEFVLDAPVKFVLAAVFEQIQELD